MIAKPIVLKISYIPYPPFLSIILYYIYLILEAFPKIIINSIYTIHYLNIIRDSLYIYFTNNMKWIREDKIKSQPIETNTEDLEGILKEPVLEWRFV